MVRILVILEQFNISLIFRGGFVLVNKFTSFFCLLGSILNCRGPPNLNFEKFKFRRKIMKKFNFKGRKLCDYIVYKDDKNRDIAIFKDYENNIQEVEISNIIKEALIKEKRKEKKQQNEFDRHIEHSEIYENKLPFRVMAKPISLEEQFENKLINKELKDAINSLSELEKRRIQMYYFENKTLREIAEIEGCAIMSVKDSLDIAISKIEKKLKNFKN